MISGRYIPTQRNVFIGFRVYINGIISSAIACEIALNLIPEKLRYSNS